MQKRVDRLLAENEALRRRLTRLEYGPAALNRALAECNDTGLAEVCTCPGCFIAKRFGPLELEDVAARFGSSEGPARPCVVCDCLRWHCERLGLTCLARDEAAESDSGSDSSSNSDASDASDASGDERNGPEDCHIVIVYRPGHWEVEYGRRLRLASLHQNNQLEALQALFDLLDGDGGFWRVAGTDHAALADAR